MVKGFGPWTNLSSPIRRAIRGPPNHFKGSDPGGQ